jgi:hypothetical protein
VHVKGFGLPHFEVDTESMFPPYYVRQPLSWIVGLEASDIHRADVYAGHLHYGPHTKLFRHSVRLAFTPASERYTATLTLSPKNEEKCERLVSLFAELAVAYLVFRFEQFPTVNAMVANFYATYATKFLDAEMIISSMNVTLFEEAFRARAGEDASSAVFRHTRDFPAADFPESERDALRRALDVAGHVITAASKSGGPRRVTPPSSKRPRQRENRSEMKCRRCLTSIGPVIQDLAERNAAFTAHNKICPKKK